MSWMNLATNLNVDATRSYRLDSSEEANQVN